MDNIKENGEKYISDFLLYSGFDLEGVYSNENLTNILGKNGNPFIEDNVEYNTLYEYLYSSKVLMNITKKENKEINKIKEYNHDGYIIILILISMGLWVINFMIIEGSLIFKCAKGFGLNLRIWSIVLPLLMCRTLLNGKIINNIKYHITLGYIYLISALGHSILHFINHIDNNLQYIIGIILMSISLLMGISSHLRHLRYDIFTYIHRVNYLILPLLLVHVTNLWIWFTVGLIIIAIEFTYNLINKTQISTLENSKISKYEDIIHLSFNRVIPNVSGAYYYIMIPSINYEWHPFSVSNCSLSDQLLFIISIRGDWTKQLKDKLKNTNNCIAIISGPFHTSSCNILNNESDSILCIAGGIGITPFLSIIDDKVQINKINSEYRSNYSDLNKETMLQKQSFSIASAANTSIDFSNFERKPKKPLNVIWVIKSPQNLIKYINDIINISTSVKFSIYITGKFNKEEDIKNKWLMINILYGSNIDCYFYKPDISKIIKGTKFDRIFFCGPERFEKDVKEICNENRVEMHSEKFD